MELKLGRVYRIELCSGELRCWRYLGSAGGEFAWWRDEETELEFSEASLLYAWQVVGEA